MLLTKSQVITLDSLYKAHEKKTSNEIALIISGDLPDSSILKSAAALGNQYGVGKKGSNNGVIILVCPRIRQVAIATGYGTEKVLTNEIANKFIGSLMIPRFKEGKYFEGIWDVSLEITRFLELPGNKIRPKS
jgi:uncharacterized protein